MDRILNSLKKENGPRASSAPALGLNTIIFKHVYWYMQQTQVSVYRTIGPLVCKILLQLRPLIDTRFSFSLNIVTTNRISPNFVCTSTLTRSSLRLLPLIFCKILMELQPLIDFRNLFPFNILTESDQILYTYQHW